MNETVLDLQGVHKRFGDMSVLRGVDAIVRRGAVTAFVGPNGAGKTTLFHCIAGDLRPETGRIEFRGQPIVGLSPWRIARQGLGRFFQDVRVFRNLTVLENVMLALHDHPAQTLLGSLLRFMHRGTPRVQVEGEARDYLRQMGLEGHAGRLAGALSWGNQKLLAMARLLAGTFDFLLLDEPTAGVSPVMVERLEAILRRVVAERGVTVALIEHNMGFVSKMANYTYVLRAGVVHDHGPTTEVLERPENVDICIGL
jgi:ABC-type branched-subunit amino acid transport system ATPase component